MKRTPLVRTTPLIAKAQLARVPFKAVGWQSVPTGTRRNDLGASTRLAQVSPKRRKEQAERSKVLRVMFPEPVVCAVPDCTSVATDPHEPLTRGRGGSITDPNNIVGLCRHHHDAIHSEPPWAYELGLLRHSWDKPTGDAA